MAALLTSSLCLKIHLSRFLFCTTRLVNKVVCVCVCVCVCSHARVCHSCVFRRPMDSVFYPPPNLELKLGSSPFLGLPPPTSTSCHQKHLGQNAVKMSKRTMTIIDVTTTGTVSNKFVLNRIQRKQWNTGVKKDQYKKLNTQTISVSYFFYLGQWTICNYINKTYHSPLVLTGRRLSSSRIGIEVTAYELRRLTYAWMTSHCFNLC